VTPGDACASDGALAVDRASGTQDNATCGDPNADRHRFGGYNVSVLAGSAVNGITVRLDAFASGPLDSAAICVELSWDGGATWTSTQTTAALSAVQGTYLVGGAADNWGRTWSATDLANGSFVVRLTDVAAKKKSKDFRLDWVAVDVTYTPP